MWILTLVLLSAGGFLLVKTGMALTASSRYTFRNRTLQRKRNTALLIGILGIIMLSVSLYLFVGK